MCGGVRSPPSSPSPSPARQPTRVCIWVHGHVGGLGCGRQLAVVVRGRVCVHCRDAYGLCDPTPGALLVGGHYSAGGFADRAVDASLLTRTPTHPRRCWWIRLLGCTVLWRQRGAAPPVQVYMWVGREWSIEPPVERRGCQSSDHTAAVVSSHCGTPGVSREGRAAGPAFFRVSACQREVLWRDVKASTPVCAPSSGLLPA